MEKCLFFAVTTRNGSLAEWLGNGLQNRLRRFESATNLYHFSQWSLPMSQGVGRFFCNMGKWIAM